MVRLILSLPERRPAPGLSPQLDSLFSRLVDDRLGHRAHEVEDLIWALWMEHPAAPARARLGEAVTAIASKKLGEAELLLNELVSAHPDFAEAWNKRATLYFLQNRDAESIEDIARVLELEPRHFGALAGYGQICERRGDYAGALTAYEAALRINPHLPGVRAQAEGLQKRFRRTLH
ncbi:tetratricopeptide repeat protein [Marinibaculum pumilum]|uniref:Tetratricopeptide repeat protein n=1 Tax=Marinibaculum pumilum TaxID=1766165 RepID=A0ABV7L583_9PROT